MTDWRMEPLGQGNCRQLRVKAAELDMTVADVLRALVTNWVEE